jgi:hypothetical protein
MTEAPATPEAATARLGELSADKSWRDNLLKGDAATVGDFHTLTRLAASDPPAVAKTADEIAAAAAKVNDDAHLADFTKGARDRFPVNDDVIQQIAEGRPVSAAERDLGAQWLQQLAADKDRSAKLLAGDTELRRQMFSASVLVSSSVKSGETAKPFAMADLLKIGQRQDRDVRSEI